MRLMYNPRMFAGAFGRRRTGALGLALLTTLSGCFSYQPASLASASEGRPVRLDLTRRGAVEAERVLGPDVSAVEAFVTRVGNDSLDLRVTSVVHSNGSRTPWTGERVRIAEASVDRVRTRQLSRSRTAVAAAVTALVIVFLSSRGFNTFGTGRSGDPGTTPGGPGTGS